MDNPPSRLLFVPFLAAFVLASLAAAGGPGASTDVVTAASVKGASVVNPQGRDLATVQAVEVDPRTGKVAYIVVVPGTKDRLIPVPYGAFLLTPGGRLVLDIDQGRILTAPNYAKNGRPRWSDPAWTDEVRKFWSSGRTWQPAGGRTEVAPLRR